MNPVHWLFFIATVGLSAAVAFYGIWVRGRYSMPGVASSLTGCDAARLVLDRMGMAHVSITPVGGGKNPDGLSESDGFFLPRRIYDGRDLVSLVRAARLAFVKGQLSNSVFWEHLKRKMVFAARVTVFLGWICFLSGVFIRGLGFLMPLGLGAFSVVVLFSFLDLSFELEMEERTSKMFKDADCFEPHELVCFRKLNLAMSLERIACLVRLPSDSVSGLFVRSRHGV